MMKDHLILDGSCFQTEPKLEPNLLGHHLAIRLQATTMMPDAGGQMAVAVAPADLPLNRDLPTQVG